MRPFSHAAVTCLVLASLLGAPAHVVAQSDELPTMQQIETAWAANDFAFVRTGLEQRARQTGSALAQYRYGRVLLEGRGGPQDIAGAVTWLQRAVDQNKPEAAVLLAQVYMAGAGDPAAPTVEKSPERAAELLMLAATLGLDEAQYQLARLYAAGVGVEQDDKASFLWLLAAGQKQNAKAQFELAKSYLRGIGTEKDDEQAVEWLQAAASNGHPDALLSLARAYDVGNGVPQSVPNAMEAYRRAAEKGMVTAQMVIGGRLLFGAPGVTQDTDAGLLWSEQAAQAGSSNAMANLARAYFTGTGVDQDDAQAAQWYLRAAQYDNGRAKTALGAMYETGRGVAQDIDEAVALYRQAAQIPDGNGAQIRLGNLAARGSLDGKFALQRMVPWVVAALQADDTAAEDWLRTAATNGLRAAQSALAAHYLAQDDTTADGVMWLQSAARGGDVDAMLRLGQMHLIGDRVPLDYVLSHQWLNIAATFGAREATELRETVTALMPSEDLATAQANARKWFAEDQPKPPATVQSIVRHDTQSVGQD